LFCPGHVKMGVTDKIFTRIKTSETVVKVWIRIHHDIQNQSAFMLDVNQISVAMKNSTERSLVIIDEFGKGTLSHGTTRQYIVTKMGLDCFVQCYCISSISDSTVQSYSRLLISTVCSVLMWLLVEIVEHELISLSTIEQYSMRVYIENESNNIAFLYKSVLLYDQWPKDFIQDSVVTHSVSIVLI